MAVGVAARAWDDTIQPESSADADTPDDTSGGSDFEVHLPCRFNPASQRPGSMGGYLGNSTPDTLYTVPEDSDDGGYPVFVDPLLAEPRLRKRVSWSSRGTSRTRCSTCWPSRTRATITSTGHPAARSRISWRRWRRPPAPRPSIPRRPSPRTDVIRDYDATGKTLPEVMAELLGYAGFFMPGNSVPTATAPR